MWQNSKFVFLSPQESLECDWFAIRKWIGCPVREAFLNFNWVVCFFLFLLRLQVGKHKTLPNNAQCWSMPIKIMASIRNASPCWSLPINADQFLSIGIDWHWSAIIGIDQHWDQCQNFDRHRSALGIDQGSTGNCLFFVHWLHGRGHNPC